MKREIKFRTWWKHPEYNPDGKMYFVGGMSFATRQYGEPEFDDCGTPKEIGLMSSVNNSKIGWNSADECILMQYTGLKDKNGKEIYEGDIVENNDYVWEVTWKEGAVYIENRSKDKKGKWWIGGESTFSTVIGNIYENPELLN